MDWPESSLGRYANKTTLFGSPHDEPDAHQQIAGLREPLMIAAG